MNKDLRIISGGQSGVDRSALTFGLFFRFNIGGFCPKNRRAEDGPIDNRFPLQETLEENYQKRTELNVLCSDATLIIYDREIDAGTNLTIETAKKYNKTLMLFNTQDQPYPIKEWIEQNEIKTLNIAGSRESNSPGIFAKTYDILKVLLNS
ncbi:MAG: putative molybdenum carrier protein [Bacteroidales bacterium]